MIRVKEIQNELLHLIGWQQNYDTTDFKLAESLTQSDSGLFYQQVHPLITLDNISSLAPDFKNITFPEYVEDAEYKKGNIVSCDDQLYKALLDTTKSPYSEDWELTNPFSEWVEQKTKASIQKTVSRFINEKLAKTASKTILESKTLFDGTGRIVDVIKNRKNLVGFEIVPIRANGVTTKINKIGLQFTEPGEYTIYVMHSSMDAPIYTLKLNKVKRNSIEWFAVEDIYLPYSSSFNDAGGSWYICYFQSELPEGSQAIRKDRDWSKGPCNSCSRHEYEAWKLWSRYLEVYPFYVNEELIDIVYNDNHEIVTESSSSSLHLWDIENNQYTYDTNYGLNLDITISCDLTDFIISQKHLLQDVMLKQLGVDMLREFAYNPNVRTNRHVINASRTDILYEVDGDSSSMKKSGLGYQLNEAYKALEISTRGIDRVCMPCVNNGIRYRTV